MSKVAQVTEITRRIEKYSDIFADFSVHPVTGQLNKKINEEAVKQSVRNLLLTDKYERPFHPEIGSNLRSILFENMTPGIKPVMDEYISDVINNYEPRANLIATNLLFDNDLNSVNVEVTFGVIETEDVVTVRVVLTRNR